MNTSLTDDTLKLPKKKKVLDYQPPVEIYLANKLSVLYKTSVDKIPIPVEARDFPPQCLDRPWDPSILLFNGYKEIFLQR